MPNKTVISNFNVIEEGNTLTQDTRTISKMFKNFFSNLAESILIKLPKPPDKYNLKSVVLELQLIYLWSALLKNKF